MFTSLPAGAGAERELTSILSQYQAAFTAKAQPEENDEHDPLMDVFGISPEQKRENRQYWGRELGMCWQKLAAAICQATHPELYGPAIRIGRDEPCDFTLGRYAIDTKYRIGSGDSGTLKKLKSYAKLLRKRGFEPVLLIARNDNLDKAMSSCRAGGAWTVFCGEEAFAFLQIATGYDVKRFLAEHQACFRLPG